MPDPNLETPPSPPLITPRNLRRSALRGLALGALGGSLGLIFGRVAASGSLLALFSYGFALGSASLVEILLRRVNLSCALWLGASIGWVAWVGVSLQPVYLKIVHPSLALDPRLIVEVSVYGLLPAWVQGCAIACRVAPKLRDAIEGVMTGSIVFFGLGAALGAGGLWEPGEAAWNLPPAVALWGLAILLGGVGGGILSAVYDSVDRAERILFAPERSDHA